MDDLKLLRDFGRELEQEPPATLVRQRQRLLSAPPRRRRVSWLMLGLVAAATAVAVAIPTLLLGNRHPDLVGAGRPVNVSGVQNILLIGSDTRQGPDNAKYGPLESRQSKVSARSDTIMLVHLPADRGRPLVVSLPRDLMVQVPKCGSAPAGRNMINSAYNAGGVDCLVATVEKMTKVRVDHTVEVDFSGFKQVVDAIGGVEVLIDKPIDDPKSKLTLPVGKSMLNGEAALGYFRLRNHGDGSDLDRIKRQQRLLSAMLKKVRSGLTDPVKLRAFLEATGKAVKTDLDLESMYELATSLEGSKPLFLTVPWMADVADPNRIRLRQPEAQQFFDRLR